MAKRSFWVWSWISCMAPMNRRAPRISMVGPMGVCLRPHQPPSLASASMTWIDLSSVAWLRAQCTKSPQRGRSVTLAEYEPRQHKLRELQQTPQGREQLRERVVMEHRQAHLARRQTARARYREIGRTSTTYAAAAPSKTYTSCRHSSCVCPWPPKSLGKLIGALG